MNIEQSEKPKTELDFFTEELNLSPSEIDEMKKIADGLSGTIEPYPNLKEDEQGKCFDSCKALLEKYFEERKDRDEIKLLIPVRACKELISVLRHAVIDFFKDEEENHELSLVIDEALANVFTHSKEDSEYAAFLIKKGKGNIKEIMAMNFSEEEIPEEMLAFLNKPREEAEEALDSFSNNDIEKIVNGEEFDLEKELNGLYKKRGLEIIAQLIKEIRYEKIEAGELGFINKFIFEI